MRASAPITTLSPTVSPATSPAPAARASDEGPIDIDLATAFAERKAKVAIVSAEGPRMLKAGNWRRAAELCKAWTELELANADSYRCLGNALQAQGYHQDAITAFRKAKQYDPSDRSLDGPSTGRKGIVAEFSEQIPPLIEGTAARTGALPNGARSALMFGALPRSCGSSTDDKRRVGFPRVFCHVS